jgi:uncharacterized membrane protein YozB (DUF420 family)
MNPVSILPAVNATLNGIATILLLIGFYLIKNRRIAQHRKVMISAFVVSVIFLITYLIYHSFAGVGTRFGGVGIIRPIYFALLISHITLAAAVPVLAIITLRRGLSSRFDRHRRIARWTYPIWLYVSVTGVLVYFMLYQWFPAQAVTAAR